MESFLELVLDVVVVITPMLIIQHVESPSVRKLAPPDEVRLNLFVAYPCNPLAAAPSRAKWRFEQRPQGSNLNRLWWASRQDGGHGSSHPVQDLRLRGLLLLQVAERTRLLHLTAR